MNNRWVWSLILLIQMVAIPVAVATDVQVSHVLNSHWAVGIEERGTQLLDVSWQPELKWRFEGGGRLTGITQLRIQSEQGLQPSDMQRDSYDSVSRPVLVGDKAELEIRELYTEHSLGDWYFTLGKQQIVWGKADGLKVLDVVNPQSFREFIVDEFEQSRIPLWSVNAERSFADWTLQLLWIPDQTYHALPNRDATYAFTSPRLVPKAPAGVETRLLNPKRPSRIVADSDIGLRLTSFLGGWDLSLNYLYQYYNQPALHQQIITGPSSIVEITPRYHRTHLLGGTFSRALGNWVIRGEVGYFTDRYFITTASTDADGVGESPELSFVLGVDWTGLRETFISAQLFQSWLPDHDQGFMRRELDTSMTFLAKREFMNKILSAEVLWIANSRDGDGLVRPKVNYELEDNLTVWAGLDIFYGDKKGLFGQFDRNDRLSLGLELGF